MDSNEKIHQIGFNKLDSILSTDTMTSVKKNEKANKEILNNIEANVEISPDTVISSFGKIFCKKMYKKKFFLDVKNVYLLFIWLSMGFNWSLSAMSMMATAFLMNEPCAKNFTCLIKNKTLTKEVFILFVLL